MEATGKTVMPALGTPLAVGDVFFYRGKGSENAAVHKVVVRSIEGQIIGLAMVQRMDADPDNPTGWDDARDAADLYVQAERVDVVQRVTGLSHQAMPLVPAKNPLKSHMDAAKKRRN